MIRSRYLKYFAGEYGGISYFISKLVRPIAWAFLQLLYGTLLCRLLTVKLLYLCLSVLLSFPVVTIK